MTERVRGPLKSEHYTIIQSNISFLKKEIDAHDLADYLFSKKVIILDDSMFIRNETRKYERNSYLLEKLLLTGGDNGYAYFIDSLKDKKYLHVVEKLKQSENENNQQDTSGSTKEASLDEKQEEKDKLIQKLKTENVKLREQLQSIKAAKLELEQRNTNLEWFYIQSHSGIQRKCLDCSLLSSTYTRNCKLFMLSTDLAVFEIVEDINTSNKKSKQLLVSAAFLNLNKTLTGLLEKGMDVNSIATLKRSFALSDPHVIHFNDVTFLKTVMTPLMAAAFSGSRETVETLIIKGADVNAIDALGNTALIYLCKGSKSEFLLCMNNEINNKNHAYILNQFIKNDADIDAKGADGMTALMHTAQNGHFELSQVLISSVANVNIQCEAGRTALMYANNYHSPESSSIVSMLLSSSKIDAVDNEGNTALLYSIQHKNKDVFGLLLNAGADINIQNNEGNSALILVIKSNLKDFMEMLLQKKPLINQTDGDGNTALVNGLQLRFKHCSALISFEGVDLNVQNREGKTALMKAAEKLDLDHLRQLLEAGANVNLRDQNRRTALKFARNSSEVCETKPDVIQILQDYGATE